MRKLRLLILFGSAALLAGCQDGSPLAPPAEIGVCTTESSARSFAGAELPLDGFFAEAEREFGVSAALLKAIGYVETRWQMVEGHPEFPGQPVVYGLMGLKDSQLERAAALAGVTRDEARTRPEANIRAAAALLRSYAAELRVERSDLGAWAPAVARYSGIQLPEGQASYVHDEVYRVLRTGASERSPGRELIASLAPAGVRPHLATPAPTATTAAAVDFPGAFWRPSPNFNARPGGDIGRIAMVIIHTCEGSYTGCWSWLVNRDSRVSAHYVVKEDGSEITQLVREAERAWHIGSPYDCALNQGFECWRNGQSNNHFTIGIEHAGYASQSIWPAAQIDASARLVCSIARRHGISRDRLHVLGHAQLQPENRSDPGASWPWAQYYARIDAHCGGGPAGEIVIDSNNGGNDRSVGYLSVSSNWIATNATPGFFGTGYYFAPTGAEADPATFHFYLPAPATRTVEAWWTAGSNRSPSALFTAEGADGRRLGSVRVSQQSGGGTWSALGSWSFPAGWNSIQLSREGPAGCVVIADAIRVR